MGIGLTDVASIVAFNTELNAFQNVLIPDSAKLEDYQAAATLLKAPMLRLISAPPADAYSMMRQLVAHMVIHNPQLYSDYTIGMLGAAVDDFLIKPLVPIILYNLKKKTEGLEVVFPKDYLERVNDNEAILDFITHHHPEDLTRIGTRHLYNLVVETFDKNVTLAVGNTNHLVTLTNNKLQSIFFKPDTNILIGMGQNGKLIEGNASIHSAIGCFLLDRNIRFSKNALAQLTALECVVNQVTEGQNTLITLPGSTYYMSLHTASHDRGKTWKILEMYILSDATEII